MVVALFLTVYSRVWYNQISVQDPVGELVDWEDQNQVVAVQGCRGGGPDPQGGDHRLVKGRNLLRHLDPLILDSLLRLE